MQVSFKRQIEPHEMRVWHLQRAKTILYSWDRKSKKLDPPITPISLAGSICSWGSRNKPSETTSHAVDPSSKSKVCSILFFKKRNTPPKFSTNFLMASQSCRMWFRSKSDPFEPSNRTWATTNNWDPNSIMPWRTAAWWYTSSENDGVRQLGLWTCQYMEE